MTPADEHFDVLIVGAGISGIGGAWHLKTQRPDTSFAVLESQADFGGTWRTHRYPGVRSDSDLFTFGYRFKPWVGKPIATASEIREYLGEVIVENGIDHHIRFGHRIICAEWVEPARRWFLDVEKIGSNEHVRLSTGFLWMCQGYYRHDAGYTPQWPDMATFKGEIVHPQAWPEDLSVTDKRVVVIGSGATAATLIPAIAPDCAHVTMLQRSPTYFIAARNANALADTLRELDISPDWIHEIVRRKILFDQSTLTQRAFSEPEVLKAELLGALRQHLGPDFDIERHFTPDYLPWRQRIAFVPDADLFKAIRSGKAGVVTDQIDRFTAEGILLKSGDHLDADLIVTATGFNLNVLGDIEFCIDGRPLVFSDTVSWRGALFTGVPNMAWVFGYFRASWTLRADLIGDLVCRLLDEMSMRGATRVEPIVRDTEKDMHLSPWVDPDNFNPGYLQRGLHLLPQQGDRQPWLHRQDYWREKDEMPAADLNDGSLRFD